MVNFIAGKFEAFNFSETLAKSSMFVLLREEFDGLPTRRVEPLLFFLIFTCESSDSNKFTKDGVLLNVRPISSVS